MRPFQLRRHALPALCAAALTFICAAAAPAQTPAPAHSEPPASLSPAQVDEVQRIIRDYLLRNPQVVLEAVEKLEQSRRDEAARIYALRVDAGLA